MINTHEYLSTATPIIAQWDVTRGCNFRCTFCLTASAFPDPNELNTEQAIRLVDKLHDAGVVFLKILGGEPFFRRDMITIMSYAADKGMLILFSSNATLIDEHTAKSLSEIRHSLRYIQVSLYGASEELYKKVTLNRNGFRLVERGMELLHKYDLNFTVLVVATEHNLDKLMEYYDFAVKHQAQEFRLCVQALLGRAADNDSSQTSIRTNLWNELIPTLHALVERQQAGGVKASVDARPLLGEYLSELTGIEFYFERCTAARTMVHIDANGRCRPCPALEYLPEHLADRYKHLQSLDLQHQEFDQIWDSPVFNTFRDYYHPDRNLEQYNTGCPYFKEHICIPCPITPCTCPSIIRSLKSHANGLKFTARGHEKQARAMT